MDDRKPMSFTECVQALAVVRVEARRVAALARGVAQTMDSATEAIRAMNEVARKITAQAQSMPCFAGSYADIVALRRFSRENRVH